MKLGQTITPYIGQTVILAGVTAFLVFVALKTSQWGLMWGAAVIWTFFALFVVFIGMKYRIFWDESSVVMRASGHAERHIRYDEITEVKAERAEINEFLSQSRPFRRIVVYGSKQEPKAFIDISLRHFRLDDIQELLTAIRRCRPDLAVPAVLDREQVK